MMQLKPLPPYELTTKDGTNARKTLLIDTPKVMGILNVTPDSFSDGGKYASIENALHHCETLLNQGATIIDIGGESTRPNASEVSELEEYNRVIPVVSAIRERFGDNIWLSIDTSSPAVIEGAVQAGADIWNDVRALKRVGAAEMAAKLKIPIVLMHMRGEPSTMGAMAKYGNVVDEVINELQRRIDAALTAGVQRQNIIIDPGFGFAKNYAHHLDLMKNLSQLHSFGLPILFGVSRKRFLGEVLNKTQLTMFKQNIASDRDPLGMAAALIAVQQGVSIVRTHNAGMTVQALTLWQQMQ